MASAENSPLFFLAFILLSFHGGIIADGCPQFSLTSPPMGTYSCPGSNIIYTCVLYSSNAGLVATVWSGSAFQCASISLLQKSNGAVTQPLPSGSCGSLSAVTTNVNSTCYTSVLTIPAVQALNGVTVVCGDGVSGAVVGNDTLKIITSPGPVGTMTVTSSYVDQLTVTWTPPTTDGVPTSYNITINDSSNTQASIPANGPLQYTFTGLTNGTLYTVSVVAINCAGSSYGTSKTKRTLALPPDNTSIKALSVFNLNNTLHQFEITWTPVGGVVTMYGVYLGGGIRGYTSCTTPQCFYVVPVSVASTSYVISVASVNRDGDVGPKSNTTIYARPTTGSAAIIGGVVGGVGGAILLAVIVVIVVFVILKTKGGSKKSEDTVELGKSGSTSTPPPGSNDGTGALYQDPKAIQHVQGPGGETYAMADKPTKTSTKVSDKAKKPTATVAPAADAGGAMYQDPKDIQHTTTQAGETYAVTDKKPKPVGHVQAPAGDLYAVADAKRK